MEVEPVLQLLFVSGGLWEFEITIFPLCAEERIRGFKVEDIVFLVSIFLDFRLGAHTPDDFLVALGRVRQRNHQDCLAQDLSSIHH